MVLGYTEKYIKGITNRAKRKVDARVQKEVKGELRLIIAW